MEIKSLRRLPDRHIQDAVRGVKANDTKRETAYLTASVQIMSHGCCRSEKILCPFGGKVIGYPFSEDVRGGIESGLGLDLDHGFSVGCDDLSDHAPLIRPDLTGRNAVSSNGELTTPSQCVEGGAFSFDAVSQV